MNGGNQKLERQKLNIGLPKGYNWSRFIKLVLNYGFHGADVLRLASDNLERQDDVWFVHHAYVVLFHWNPHLFCVGVMGRKV